VYINIIFNFKPMDQKEINKQILERLSSIESRVTKLEGDDFSQGRDKSPKLRKSKKLKKIDLETPIKKLLSGRFFKEWKTDNDVIKKLKKQVLNPKRASVSNVLRRLASSKRGLLERDGEGTKKSPWRYKEKL